MAGKNSVALLATVSLIIVLLTVLCALLYAEFSSQKIYDGTFVTAEADKRHGFARFERIVWVD